MGKERAATMMSLLPPAGWADVATKCDLDVAFERLDTKIDTVAERLDTKIDAVAERLDTKIDAVAERFDAKFTLHDTRLEQMATKTDLQHLRSELQRTFVTWLLAAQATTIAAIGLLLTVVR